MAPVIETATRAAEFVRAVKLMGNNFIITVVEEEEATANEHIDAAVAEIRRIEALLSTFRADSETNRINANAGIAPVEVCGEVFSLIERSLQISALTQGAFDISYGGIDKRLWNFDKTMNRLPTPKEARKMVHLIDYRNIELDSRNRTVLLKKKGMRIGFGGIGKGYAAEMAKRVLMNHYVQSGIINASGDLVTWGKQPNGRPWTIGIAHPDFPARAFSSIAVSNMAVATSGSYEKYVEINGKRYAHTINPRTGLPVTGIKSVTTISPNAEFADAMATPIAVMGVKAGLFLVNQVPNLECIIVTDDNKLFTSQKINIV